MHNVLLIARREYLERVKTKGFLIATVLIPLLMGGLVFGGAYLADQQKTSSHIAIVSSDAQFSKDLQQSLQSGKDSSMQVDLDTPSPETRARLDAALKSRGSNLAGYLWVTPAASGAVGARPAFAYKARSAGDISTRGTLERAISSVLMRENLGNRGLPPAEINSLTLPIDLDSSDSGSTLAAFGAAYVMFFLMYMVIMLYGMNTARSIIEEKTSRVFEVLLATIKPDELLAGKILGVGAVGLTQVGVWMAAAALLSGTGLAASLVGTGHVLVSATQIVFFLAYFVFGFLLYSSIAAALGAMTNSEQELQQLNMFLVIPLATCMLLLGPIIRAPDSTLARVGSLVPFCSPLLMNFRISLTRVQPWEIGLSFVLMAVTIASILWVSARIYRVGILMYGKKPNLPEILRWLKYS